MQTWSIIRSRSHSHSNCHKSLISRTLAVITKISKTHSVVYFTTICSFFVKIFAWFQKFTAQHQTTESLNCSRINWPVVYVSYVHKIHCAVSVHCDFYWLGFSLKSNSCLLLFFHWGFKSLRIRVGCNGTGFLLRP